MIDSLTLVGASPRLVPASEYTLPALVRELRQHGDLGCAGRRPRARDTRSPTISRCKRLARRTACACIQWRPSTRCSTWTGAPSWSGCWRRAPLPCGSSRCQAGASDLRPSRRWFARFVGDVRCSCRSPSSATRVRSAQPPRRRMGPWCSLGGHYTQLGDCLAALERWPHLYLETSRLAQFRGVETVVRDGRRTAAAVRVGCAGASDPGAAQRGADRGHRRRRQARHPGRQRQPSVRAAAEPTSSSRRPPAPST